MKRNVVVAVGVVIVVGTGIWWWLRDRASPAPPSAVAAVAPTAPGPRRDRAQRTGEIPQQGALSVMIDDDPGGTLRLEGQVVDADDHGVAGATVVLAANPPRTQVTEADGGFAFDHLVGRPYTLIARAARGVAGPITARLTAKSDPVVLRLRPAAKLTVSVVGPGGKPFDNATVELRGVDEQRVQVRGKPAVFAAVVPGSYQLAAWADGMAHAFQRIQIGSADAEARLVLASGAPVTGRVVDDRGTGVAGARVRYAGASDWSVQASTRLDGAVSAADGSFRFDALPAGSFRFIASHPERAPGTSALVTLDGKSQHDGVVIAMPIGAVVRGHVVDAQHHPVASARVRIDAATGPRPGSDPPRQTYSDAQGAFEIKGLPRKLLSAIALDDTAASQNVAVDTTAGDVDALTITLDVTGTIAGTVVDPDGHPVEGAQVTAGPALGDRGFDPGALRLRGLPEEVTDASGGFKLTGLAPGEYRIAAAPATRMRRDFRNGVTAPTGATNVRLVVAPDGSVRGKVAFSDGGAPGLFAVSIQQNQQSFVGGDGSFELDGIAPASYRLVVRGPSFQTQSVEITVASLRTTDAGTITVVKGRSIAGIVVADGQPVAGATVYAGRAVFGNGTASAAQPAAGPLAAAFGDAAKTATTDASGGFTLSGFSDGDLTLVAEHDTIGRSRALRLPTVMPGQTELTISLEKFGALSGTLRQTGQPIDGVLVSCQSTSTPGAVYTVAAGSDGGYRFDRLAPDVYKVSATVRTTRFGARFYSQQATVPPGKEITVDLTVDPGSVALDVAIAARSGSVGGAGAWLTSGAITARTVSELQLKLAGAGAGTSARGGSVAGEPVHFSDLTPGPYSVCIAPLPREVKPAGALAYYARHSDTLATFCSPVTLAPSPATQTTHVVVDVPPLAADGTGSGPGSGSGSGSGR